MWRSNTLPLTQSVLEDYRGKISNGPDKKSAIAMRKHFSFTLSLFYLISFTSSVYNRCLSFSFGRDPWQMSHYIYKHSIEFGMMSIIFHCSCSLFHFTAISYFLMDTWGLSCGPKFLSTQFTLKEEGTKKAWEKSEDERCVHYFVCGNCFTSVYICQYFIYTYI